MVYIYINNFTQPFVVVFMLIFVDNIKTLNNV